MATSSDPTELTRVVNRRFALLSAVADGPVEKRDLVTALSVSRSTVDRGLRTLRTHALVDRRGNGYVATLPGRLALAEFARAEAAVDAAGRARDVLAHLSPDVPMDTAMLSGAEVHVASPPAPRQPLDRLSELIEDAHTYRGFSTSVLDPNYVGDMQDRVLAGDVDLEFIFSRDIAAYLAHAHEDAVRQTLAAGATMYELPEVPYGFGIMYGQKTHAYILAVGDDGAFKGLLLNDDPAAIAWAEDVYTRHRTRATAVELPPS